MHQNGNLALYGPAGEQIWSTYTKDIDIQGGLKFQPDGHAYLYETDGFNAWSTRMERPWQTGSTKAEQFAVKDNGDMGTYTRSGGAYFTTGTSHLYTKKGFDKWFYHFPKLGCMNHS